VSITPGETAFTRSERDGYQPLTIKAIADHAGVGRQTVYRWWPDKEEILLEAPRPRHHRRGVPAAGGIA
jgi:transposase